MQGRAMTAILAGPLDGETLELPFLIHVLDVVNNNPLAGHSQSFV